jgi:hypothetical protein
MGNLALIFEIDTLFDTNSTLTIFQLRRYSLRYKYTALYHFFHPIELGFFVVANLLVLHRMQHQYRVRNDNSGTDGVLQKRALWPIRLFFGAVIACNVTGFLGNVVATVQWSKAGDLYSEAAEEYRSENVSERLAYLTLARAMVSTSASTSSIQRFCEAIALLTTSGAFLIAAIRSHRVIATALRDLSAFVSSRRREMQNSDGVSDHSFDTAQSMIEKGTALQRKIWTTFLLLAVIVVLRSAFSVLSALTQSLQDISNKCAIDPCDSCKNDFTHIHYWLLYTPALQQTVILITSPVCMLFALWGMS